MAAVSLTAIAIYLAAFTNLVAPITPAESTRVIAVTMEGIATTVFMAQGQSAKPADRAAIV